MFLPRDAGLFLPAGDPIFLAILACSFQHYCLLLQSASQILLFGLLRAMESRYPILLKIRSMKKISSADEIEGRSRSVVFSVRIYGQVGQGAAAAAHGARGHQVVPSARADTAPRKLHRANRHLVPGLHLRGTARYKRLPIQAIYIFVTVWENKPILHFAGMVRENIPYPSNRGPLFQGGSCFPLSPDRKQGQDKYFSVLRGFVASFSVRSIFSTCFFHSNRSK